MSHVATKFYRISQNDRKILCFHSFFRFPVDPKVFKGSFQDPSEASFSEGIRSESIWPWILWARWLQKSSKFVKTPVKHIAFSTYLHLLGDVISPNTCKTYHFRHFLPLAASCRNGSKLACFQIRLLMLILGMFAHRKQYTQATENAYRYTHTYAHELQLICQAFSRCSSPSESP